MNVSELKKELEPVVESSVELIISVALEKGIKLDREDVKCSVEFDIYKCLSNYILESDVIENVNIKRFPIRVSFSVEREGNSVWFETEQIIASGPVQKMHYRYIAKTNLRKLVSKLSILSDVENRIKYRSQLKRLEYAVEDLERNIKSREISLAKNEAKTIEEYSPYLFEYQWTPENRNFESKEIWDAWLENAKRESIELHEEHLQLDRDQLVSVRKSLEKAKKKLNDFKGV